MSKKIKQVEHSAFMDPPPLSVKWSQSETPRSVSLHMQLREGGVLLLIHSHAHCLIVKSTFLSVLDMHMQPVDFLVASKERQKKPTLRLKQMAQSEVASKIQCIWFYPFKLLAFSFTGTSSRSWNYFKRKRWVYSYTFFQSHSACCSFFSGQEEPTTALTFHTQKFWCCISNEKYMRML